MRRTILPSGSPEAFREGVRPGAQGVRTSSMGDEVAGLLADDRASGTIFCVPSRTCGTEQIEIGLPLPSCNSSVVHGQFFPFSSSEWRRASAPKFPPAAIDAANDAQVTDASLPSANEAGGESIDARAEMERASQDALDSALDASVDATSESRNGEAWLDAHGDAPDSRDAGFSGPIFPQVPIGHGPVWPSRSSPFLPGDSLRTEIDAFNAWILRSDYWKALGKEYGVGPGTLRTAVEISTAAPTTITQTAIADWIAASIEMEPFQLPMPTPPTSSCTPAPPQSRGLRRVAPVLRLPRSCSCSFDAQEIEVPYAVIARCGAPKISSSSPATRCHTSISKRPLTLSNVRPAWVLDVPSTGSDKPLERDRRTRVSDLCTNEPYARDRRVPSSACMVNQAAASGLNPCQPNPPNDPYFIVFSDKNLYEATPGEKLEIVARAWSNRPTSSWMIGINTAWEPPSDWNGHASLSRTTASPGDYVTISVQVPPFPADGGTRVYDFTVDLRLQPGFLSPLAHPHHRSLMSMNLADGSVDIPLALGIWVQVRSHSSEVLGAAQHIGALFPPMTSERPLAEITIEPHPTCRYVLATLENPEPDVPDARMVWGSPTTAEASMNGAVGEIVWPGATALLHASFRIDPRWIGSMVSGVLRFLATLLVIPKVASFFTRAPSHSLTLRQGNRWVLFLGPLGRRQDNHRPPSRTRRCGCGSPMTRSSSCWANPI